LRRSPLEQFRQLFKEVPVAEEIYSGNLTEVADPLKELSAVNHFLTERGLAWQPPEEPCQHYAEEMREYLEEARQRFSDAPDMQRALRNYQRDVGNLMEQ